MSTVIAPHRGEVLPRHVTRWLVIFVVAAALVLGAALAIGATTVFNVLV